MLSACGGGGAGVDNTASPAIVETASQGSQTPAQPDSPVSETEKSTSTIKNSTFDNTKLVSFQRHQQSANRLFVASEAQNTSFTNVNGVFRLPLASQQTIGNLTISVAVDDPDGISDVFLGFEGSSQALTLCDSDCASVFTRTVTGVNPLEFGLSSGPLRLELWSTDLNGNKVIIATVNIQWQATAITGITPVRVVNNIAVSWNPLNNYLRYNVYIAKQDGVTYQNYQRLEGGEAFLALIDPEIELTGISNDQIISLMVTGVDGSGESAFSDTIKIGALNGSTNLSPIAQDDTFTMNEDETLNANVISNDSDPENRSLMASTTLILEPKNGAVILNSDGNFSYIPKADFTGRDYFYYAVKDDFSQTDTAAVVINVIAVNDAPEALFDGYNLLSTAATGRSGKSGIGKAKVSVNGFLEIDAPGLLINDLDIDDTNLIINTTPAVAPTQGTVVLNADGSFRYTPIEDASGEDSFTYEVIDGRGAVSQSVVRITIDGASFPPIAANDRYTLSQDQTFNANNSGANNVSLLGNDIDLDPDDSLTVNQVTSLPKNGSLVFAADGTFTFTPNSGFFGVDFFVYQITDNQGNTSSAAAIITVNRVNQLPIAIADNYEFDEDNSLNVEATDGLLANDSDPDLDPISISLTPLQGPASGDLTLSADGSFDYIPNDNYFGSDSFRYQIFDDSGGLTQATVTLTINNVNDDPVALDDSLQTIENTPVTIDVLDNDSDIEEQILIVVAATLSRSDSGIVVINGDYTLTFTPTSGFLGLVNIDYTIVDGAGGSASAQVIVTVNRDNQAPAANPDSYSLIEDSQLTVNNARSLLTNDVDSDNDILSVNPTPQINVTHGILVLNIDGSFSYQPNANFFGTDTFDYQINDGNGATSTATVTLQVTPINDAPFAVNDTATSVEDTLVNINVLANDTDVENDLLSITDASAQNGSADILSNNTINYSPRADFSGTDIVIYSIVDSNGATATAEVNVTVIAVNDPPVAINDVFSTSEDTSVDIDVLTNDSDPDRDILIVLTAIANSGSVVIDSDQSLIYTPNLNFNGSDTINYIISDNNGGTASTTVSMTVTAVNDVPVITIANTLTVDEDNTQTLTFTFDDIDGDTVTATVSAQAENGVASVTGTTVSYIPNANFNGSDSFVLTLTDGKGFETTQTIDVKVSSVNDVPVITIANTLTVDEDNTQTLTFTFDDIDGDTVTATVSAQAINGAASVTGTTVSYIPNANFFGTDSFTLTLTDNAGFTTTQVINVTVILVNDVPTITIGSTLTTDEDNTQTLTFTFDDIDGDTVTATVSAQAENGVASVTGTTVSYIPNANFFGTDSFTLTLTDNAGFTTTEVINVNISAVNNQPVAVNDSGTVAEDSSIGFAVLNNDTDVDGDSLIVTTASAINGTVNIVSSTQVNYLPNSNFNGSDTISYTIIDNNGGTASATVTLTVTAVNDIPVAGVDNINTNEDTLVNIDVLANDSDIDGDTLTITAATATSGSVTIDSGISLTYTPNVNFSGTDNINYTVSDGNGGNVSSTVTVTVNQINDAPVFPATGFSVAENSTTVGNVLATDADGDSLTYAKRGGVDVELFSIDAATGALSFNAAPDYETPGDTNTDNVYALTLSANDGEGATVSTAVTVTVTNINDAPVFPATGFSVAENSTTVGNVLATDADGDSLTYAKSGGVDVELFSIDAVTGALSFITAPNFEALGSASLSNDYTLTLSVSDSIGDAVSTDVTISVTDVNEAPVVNGTLAPQATVNNDYEFLIGASDAEGETLIWSVTSGFTLPSWLALDTTASAYESLGTAGFSAGVVEYTSLALDSNDTPYVAYSDIENSGKVTVMKKNGTAWDVLGNAGFSEGVATYISLALDNNDNLYVAYRDNANGNEATLMKFNGTAWVVVGGAGFSAGVVEYTSLAFDSLDTPYVAYRDIENSGKVTVMKKNGTAWDVVGNAGFSEGVATYISLALDINDNLYVAYRDFENGNKATVMVFPGTAWEVVGGAVGFSAGVVEYTSLAHDSNYTPYVAYRDIKNSGKVTVMKFDGAAWVVVGDAGFSEGVATYISLALDSDGDPYVAYRDFANDNKVTVMKYVVNVNEWVLGTAGTSQGVASYISLALDSNDIPYVAYRDFSNANKATMMSFNETKLSGTPSNSDLGVHAVNLDVSDGTTPLSVDFDITVALQFNVAASTEIIYVGTLDSPDVFGEASITYQISIDDASLFSIDASFGVLEFNSPPTYDPTSDNTYNITVTATDDITTVSVNVVIIVEPPPEGEVPPPGLG
jgi:VCBS repeat-containing protein